MQEPAAVPPLAFSHVGVYVRDLAVMEDFYSRVLGFIATDRGNLGTVQLVFLSRDAAEHHQIVLASGRPDAAHFSVINSTSPGPTRRSSPKPSASRARCQASSRGRRGWRNSP